MDDETKQLIRSGNPLVGIWHWLTYADLDESPTWFDRFTLLISRMAMTLTTVAVIVTFYEVILRYLFGSPTLWVNELTLWLGSIIFLLAGVYAMQRRSHIRITAVYDLLPARAKFVCDVCSTLVIVAYAAMMIFASYKIVWHTLITWERFGTFWNPPIPATIKPLVLIATALVAVQAVNNLIVDGPRMLRSDKEGNGSK